VQAPAGRSRAAHSERTRAAAPPCLPGREAAGGRRWRPRRRRRARAQASTLRWRATWSLSSIRRMCRRARRRAAARPSSAPSTASTRCSGTTASWRSSCRTSTRAPRCARGRYGPQATWISLSRCKNSSPGARARAPARRETIAASATGARSGPACELQAVSAHKERRVRAALPGIAASRLLWFLVVKKRRCIWGSAAIKYEPSVALAAPSRPRA